MATKSISDFVLFRIVMNFFKINLQKIDYVQISPDEEKQENTEINQVGSGRTVSMPEDLITLKRGAWRRLRGNHREGQIVNNNNVHQRQSIRNQISQAANRQNPIVNIWNNQTPRRIVFDSENFEISNPAPIEISNPIFKEYNINYEVSFKDLPNNHHILILYG